LDLPVLDARDIDDRQRDGLLRSGHRDIGHARLARSIDAGSADRPIRQTTRRSTLTV
jgi:hypothetical protein